MVDEVLQRFGFQFSSPQPTPLSTSHSLSAPPSDESVEPSGPYPELVGCLITSGMGLVLGGRDPVVLTGHADASWFDDLATQRSSRGYSFSLVLWHNKTATDSTASSSPSPCSSALLALSRSPSKRDFVAIAPYVSALVAKMTLAVEPSATEYIVIVVIAVSATPAASIEVVAAKSTFPLSSAPSTAIPSADTCCPGAIRTRQLTAAEILLKDRSLHVLKREAGQVTIEVDDERGSSLWE
ncbi:unnamed protein product [Closterium sp. NIES-54]